MKNGEAWTFAIGMVRMAGLEPSEEMLGLIEQEKRGEINMNEMKEFLDRKYKNGGE